jgi:hypothetical protein
MKIERFKIQSCCGKMAIMFKTDQPLSKKFLLDLVGLGFTEHNDFSKSGILYVDNLDVIISGPFGSNRLQIKCKKADCDKRINDIETLLLTLD